MSSLPLPLVGSPRAVGRVARPLACSLVIHVGLGAIVVLAGSVGWPSPPPRTVWLDLEPMVVPAPPTPAPSPPATPRRPVRKPMIERRPAPAPPTPVTEQPVPPPQPLPSSPREAAPAEPPAQSSPVPPPTAAAMESPKVSDLDRSGAAPIVAAGVREPIETPPARVSQPGGAGAARSVVASRTPDVAPDGPIVRTARPKGGYQVRPVYPESARRAGIQGTTLLRIHIEADGRVSEVSVQRSAGHQSLDEAAAEAVRRWRFDPALDSAGPVSMWAVVPVEFRISDRD